jgi:hypothetical protein
MLSWHDLVSKKDSFALPLCGGAVVVDGCFVSLRSVLDVWVSHSDQRIVSRG